MNHITICGYKGCNNKAEYGPCNICVWSIMKDREEGKKIHTMVPPHIA